MANALLSKQRSTKHPRQPVYAWLVITSLLLYFIMMPLQDYIATNPTANHMVATHRALPYAAQADSAFVAFSSLEQLLSSATRQLSDAANSDRTNVIFPTPTDSDTIVTQQLKNASTSRQGNATPVANKFITEAFNFFITNGTDKIVGNTAEISSSPNQVKQVAAISAAHASTPTPIANVQQVKVKSENQPAHNTVSRINHQTANTNLATGNIQFIALSDNHIGHQVSFNNGGEIVYNHLPASDPLLVVNSTQAIKQLPSTTTRNRSTNTQAANVHSSGQHTKDLSYATQTRTTHNVAAKQTVQLLFVDDAKELSMSADETAIDQWLTN